MTATTPRKKEWWERDAAPQFEYVPVEEPRGLPKKEGAAPERTWGEAIADRGLDLAKGVVGAGEAVVGLADLATGGRAGKFMADTLHYDPQAAREMLTDMHSEKARAAQQNFRARMDEAKGLSLGERVGTGLFAALENPDIIAQAVTESLPLTLAGGGVGGAAMKGAAKAAGSSAAKAAAARGMSAAAQQRAAQMAAGKVARGSTWAGAFGEGLTGAGSAAEAIRQESDDGLLDAKGYAAALGTGATTGAFGALGGKIGAKLGLEDIETAVARGTAGLGEAGAQAATQQAKRGILGRVLGGAAQEGLLEELPQSVTETLWQNWAQGKEDIWEGVDEAAVIGVLSGAAMGGVANVRARSSGYADIADTTTAAPPPVAPQQANPQDSSVAGGDVAQSAGASASNSAQEQEASNAAGGQMLGARAAADEVGVAETPAQGEGANPAVPPADAPDAAPRDDVSDALGAGAVVEQSVARAALLGQPQAQDDATSPSSMSYDQPAQMRQGARDSRVRAAIAEELQARRAQVEAASTDELAALRNETGQGSAARTVIDRQLARRAGALSEDTAQALATGDAASALPDTDLAAAYDALTARLALSMQDGTQLPIPARGGALERVAGELDRRSGMDDATNAGGAFPLARSSWSDAVLQDIADYAYTPETRAVAAGALAARRGDTEAASSWRNNIPPRRSDGRPAAFQQWQLEREQRRAARSDAANQLSDTLEQAKQQGGMLSGAAVDNADAIPALNEPRGFPALPMPQTLGATGQTLGAAPQVSGAYPALGGAYPAQRAAQPPDAPMQNAARNTAPQRTPDAFPAAAQEAATLPALSTTAAPNQGAFSDRTAGDRAAASSGEPIAQGAAMVNRAGDRAPLTRQQEAEGARAYSAAQQTPTGVRKLQGELMRAGFAPERATQLAMTPWAQIPAADRPAEEFVRDDASYPYLLESEMAPVEQAFDALFAGMKQRETDRGVALFSRKKTVPEKMRSAAAEREFNETERAYGGKAAYDAAKKVGKTKLSYQQWVQVRTPSFKKWFGDWESLASREFFDGEPVATLTGNEFVPDGTPLTEKVAQYWSERGQSSVNVPGVGDVALDKRAAKDSFNHPPKNRLKAVAFAALPDVLRHGRIIHGEGLRGSRADIGRVFHIAAPVEIKGQMFVVHTLVKAEQKTSRLYTHHVWVQKKLRTGEAFKTSADAAEAGVLSGASPDGAMASMMQRIYSVKSQDVSAVVDQETGEPQVVYHGSIVRDSKRAPGMGDITAFDRMFTTRFRKPSIDTVGSWFSTNPGEGGAQMYSGAGEGSVIYPVFLNIKAPEVTSFQLMTKRARILANGKNDGRMVGAAEVDAYRNWLAQRGKDGIKIETSGNEGSTEFDRQDAFIALEPNQIKSATGNVGTFDVNSPDIRWRRGDTPATNTSSPAYEAGDASNTAKPLTAKQQGVVNRVRLMAASIQRVWQNAPKIEVVWDLQDDALPQAIRDMDAAMRSQGAQGDAEAVYHGGKVYVLASQVSTPRDMVRVVAHEVLGHHGLRGAFGRGMARVLNELMIARRAEVVQQAREYGLLDADKLPAGVDVDSATDAQVWAAMSRQQREQAAEEVLAHLAQTYPKLDIVRRAIAAIRTWLRQHVPGFDRMGVSDDEIVRSFILPAREWVQRGMGVGTAPGTPLFRRAWHGGSAGIEREGFKLQKIGTGEGAQAFGWGMYFASQQRIADWYRQQYKIDHPERDAALYALKIPEDEDLLAWDAPLSESSVAVQRGVQQALQLHGTNIADLARLLYPGAKGSAMGLVTGKDVYNALAGMARDAITVPLGNDLGENMRRDRRAASVAQRSASEDLYSVGIPGLRYLDETSRERGEASRDGRPMGSKRRTKAEGTHNYVLWDEALLTPEAAQITPMFSRSAQKSVEANITRGRAAMNRALLEKADQHRAMFRNGLGWVDFVWGDAKRGIQHIIEQRMGKDGMSRADVERMLTEQVVSVIAQGAEKLPRATAANGAVRVHIEHEGVRASLVRQPGSNAWLLTAFELKTPDAKAAANDTAKATHRAADSSDGAAGAGVAPHPAGRGATPSADTAAAPIRTRHSGGSNDSVSSKRASSQAPLFSRSKKQTPEQRADALRYGGAGTASEQRMSFMESALAHAGRLFTHPGRVSLWDKTVGTPRHLAERVPAFKPVYEAAMATVEDVSTLANTVMDAAPRWIPKLEGWQNLAPWRKEFTRAVSAQDSKAVAKPLFEGTLVWGRDAQGNLVQTDALQKKYGHLGTAQLGKALLRDGYITEAQLKGWLAMPQHEYDNMVGGVLEDVVRGGTTFTDAQLREHFNLTDGQISLYREARAAIDASLDVTTRTDMLRLVQHEFGSRRDEWQQLRQEVLDADSLDAARRAIKDALEEFAGDATPKHAEALRALADDLGERAHRVQELMRRGYAPLTRFGRYTVDVVDKATGERLYFGMYESRAESNLARIKLAQAFQGAEITQGTLSEREFELFQGVTPETLELFGQALALDSEGGEASDLVFQEYLRRTKNNHSALKRMIHRKGIAGYSEDVGRVLASFIYSNARAGSQAMNAGQLEKAITEIPKSQGQLKDLAVGLRDYLRNPREGGQIVRGFLFAQYLGGSVASALVNATQPFQVTMPWLSQFGGMAKASRQMARALKDMPTGNYEPALKKALKAAEADGTVSPQEIHHLMAQARGVGSLSSGDGTKAGRARAVAGNAWQRLKVAWGVPFSLAEQFNRRTTFIAAWRTATEQLKMGEAQAAEFARKAVQETQFVYSRANRPAWARGTIGGTLFCVDDTTEALTQRGWLGCDDLRHGDMLASFDMTTGRLKWMPMKSVHVFEHEGEMIHATAKTLDMLTTPDHRVVHYKQRRTPGAGRNAYHWELGVAEMQDIKASGKVQIPTAAPFDHEPVGKPIPDAIIPLLGWVATEGCIHKKNRGREEWGGHITIGQNEGEKADMIRADLRAAGIPFKERYWNYENGNATHVNFYINKTNAAPLRELLPGKQITPEVLMRMSKAQIEVLVDRLLQGDGYVNAGGVNVFLQNPGATLETFQMALTILGKSFSVRKHGGNTKAVILREPKKTAVGRYSISKKEVVHYKGRVWCPIVPKTSTWVARRNGLPFITHNTFKTYMVSYLELMQRMWTQGGKEGKRAVAWSLAMLLLVGGAGGVPFMEDAEDLIDGAGQLMGYNVSAKHWREDFLRKTLGDELGGFLESGVSGLPGAPIDVSGRLGMGNLIPGTGLLLTKHDRSQDLKEMAGAAGDFISRAYGGIKTGTRWLATGDVGELSRAALEVAPNAVKNAIKGVDMFRHGMYRDAKGYKVVDTKAAEALAKLIGFQPGSVARVQEANSFMQRSKSFYQQKAADIRLEWAQALFEKDETKLARVRQKLADWNRKNPEQRITVDMRSVWKRVREMKKDRSQRIADTSPKALRRQMRELAAEARGETASRG